MTLEKYSFGIGDRFGKEGRAQLRAIQDINRRGFPVVPVWNKSNREHELTGTTQASVRHEADDAVKVNGWRGNYYVDADHITLDNVDKFMAHSDFFTIDVAHAIGKPADPEQKADFLRRYAESGAQAAGRSGMPFDAGIFADTYLRAISEVKRVYDHISSNKPDGFIAEISMDEVMYPQSPNDLYFILKELKDLGIEPHTIAPKFSGLFPKGVDYQGDIETFRREFSEDLKVLRTLKRQLDFSHDIKLSVHSGSDKFSLYPVIRELVRQTDAGVHIKTAGTTWLEEVIGLSRGGGEGLRLAKEIYRRGISRYDELTKPYLSVLHIDTSSLPPSEEVMSWTSERFSKTLIHDQSCRHYNPDFRQLVHVAYKVAAEMGAEFTDALDYFRDPIEEQVYVNLYERHLLRLL